MSSSRRGVGGREKGSFEVVEDNGAARNRTLPTAGSVRNLGQSPRVWGRGKSWTGAEIASPPGVGQGRVFQVPCQLCRCCP